MNNKLDISVVICTHTEARWKFLVEAVKSIQFQKVHPKEIIVVIDNNPKLAKKVRNHLPNVIAVENSGMRGASDSKNSGIASAKSSIVAFLDDDAVASSDWLVKLTSGFYKPEVCGVGGKTEPLWPGEQPNWFPEEFYWVVGCTHRGMPEIIEPVRNLIACNMAVRLEVFSEVGGFRNEIGPAGVHALGCEETEFCIRANQYYSQNLWIHQPKAIVQHQVPASRESFTYFLRRCYGEGRSKALVTYFVGSEDGLSSERKYLSEIIPGGISQGIRDVLIERDIWGFARAGAILVGLTVTVVGYLIGISLLSLAKNSDFNNLR